MSALTRFTTFLDGDSLPAADLEGEFDELHDALTGAADKELEIHSAAGAPLTLNGKAGAAPLSCEIDGTEKVSVNSSGQVDSSVATGTAPFVVASTTKVANLNADTLDGADVALLARAVASGYCGVGDGRVSLVAPPLPAGFTKYTFDFDGCVESISTGSITVKAEWLGPAEGETAVFSSTTTLTTTNSDVIDKGSDLSALAAALQVVMDGVGGGSVLLPGDCISVYIDGIGTVTNLHVSIIATPSA